jgi:8-oxo-dGTP diphosphatase
MGITVLDYVTEKHLRELAKPAQIKHGHELAEKGDITFGVFRPDHVEARLELLGSNTRHTILELKDGKLDWRCTCTSNHDNFCRHLVATALAAHKEGQVEIHKAAGIIIQDRKLLHERSSGKPAFIAPGGRIEEGEMPRQALVRELKEELNIDVDERDLEPFDTFTAEAANHPGQIVHMQVFHVRRWKGDIVPASEVDEIRWLGSIIPEGIKVGSISVNGIMPRLKAKGLID